MNEQLERSGGLSRRVLLSRGAKAAYVAPVVIAAMRAESAFADNKDKDKDKKGGPSAGN